MTSNEDETKQVTAVNSKPSAVSRFTARKKQFIANTVSTLVQRLNLALRAGLTFGGARDFYAVFGYRPFLEFNDLMGKYLRQDIAQRVVDAPAKATWRKIPKLKTEESFNDAWSALCKKLNLWQMFERVDKLCGIGRYSILLLGFDDTDNIEQPLTAKKTELLYVQPFSEVSARVSSYVAQRNDARYGLPDMYELELVDPSMTGQAITGVAQPIKTVKQRVHSSRVIHVAEGLLEDNVFGQPRMQIIYNRLDDMEKVVGGASEMFWLAGNRGLHADVDKEMDMDPTDATALDAEVEEYMHQLRRVIRTRGVNIKSLGSEVADPTGVFRVVLALISAATGIPQRVLMGAEIGQLASEQDRANWADRVAERQMDFAEPAIIRPFIAKAMATGNLPTLAADFDVEWPDAFTLSPLEMAQKMAQQARSAINFSKQLDSGFPITTREEARVIMGLPAEPGPGMGKLPTKPTSTNVAIDLKETAPAIDPNAKARQPTLPFGNPTSPSGTSPSRTTPTGSETSN